MQLVALPPLFWASATVVFGAALLSKAELRGSLADCDYHFWDCAGAEQQWGAASGFACACNKPNLVPGRPVDARRKRNLGKRDGLGICRRSREGD